MARHATHRRRVGWAIPAVPAPPQCDHPTGIRAPDPRFRTAKTPAGRRSSRPDPAPGGQPDPPHPTRGSEGLTLTNGSAGALCLTCITGY